MLTEVAFIGFGEAGRTFAGARGWQGAASAYDVLTDGEATHAEQQRRYADTGVTGTTTLYDALSSATVVLSVVTADQALIAARNAAQYLRAGALYFDMNSVAPDTKRGAARIIENAGGRYVDVAVMAPVDPAGMNVPLLISGPHSQNATSALRTLGFINVRALPGDVGQASSVKMIRSVMVKGIEALTAEMLLAAEAADVADEVLASLGDDWRTKADYNLDRMLVHGARRAAEMREAAKTLEALGVEPVMTRGTIRRQAELGTIGKGSPKSIGEKLGLAA